jgi:hypothetical protein
VQPANVQAATLRERRRRTTARSDAAPNTHAPATGSMSDCGASGVLAPGKTGAQLGASSVEKFGVMSFAVLIMLALSENDTS